MSSRCCPRPGAWCAARGVLELSQIQPLHVARFIEELTQTKSAPTAKQHLAAIRMLFDWLVVGQVVMNVVMIMLVTRLVRRWRGRGREAAQG